MKKSTLLLTMLLPLGIVVTACIGSFGGTGAFNYGQVTVTTSNANPTIGESFVITATLSSVTHSIGVTFTASNANISIPYSSSCNIQYPSSNMSCTWRGYAEESGSVTITASAANYTNGTTTLTVQESQ